MEINIIAVGKLKEKYLQDGIDEYIKRLSKFAKVNIIEIQDEKLKENISFKEIEKIKQIEGNKILSHIKSKDYIISLALNGKTLDSVEFSETLSKIMIDGYSSITFIIGASLGLSQDVLDKSDLKLSFSKFTFPHQLMRLILIEQIYRAFKIINNETYHK
ncbi:23S rRNA (pseudouridine(1915)-N(3))-methyltransferase RlmH [Soehngenia longivitae]|uniref:Ribosomal RNA large subunit methyltransferase H n=1 Tax=Soehngenia longivitae TaxID=2562294 RepID=A0A4Z0D8V8_9FIRM|nr:23S rRNA (pseudouridine(1915)-N(3))-methyltransferase RlmH [Soehngenia longivitae]TFZ41327.1 23S rRNA (pseudouridine(1915)-N(3))-methyltransferase RlmH [Soehngenia longivitae]